MQIRALNKLTNEIEMTTLDTFAIFELTNLLLNKAAKVKTDIQRKRIDIDTPKYKYSIIDIPFQWDGRIDCLEVYRNTIKYLK